MALIRHLNIPNAKGEIYCCLRNRVVGLDEEMKALFCAGCGMFRGDSGGRGIVCDWEDDRGVSDPYLATDPHREWMSNQVRTTSLSLQPPVEPGFGLFLGTS